MQLPVRFKRIHPEARIPEYKTSGSAAFDFYLIEDIEIPPQDVAIAPTGLIIQIPENNVLIIASRSSSPLKHGLTLGNGIGVIDSDYRGPEDEIGIIVHNFSQKPVLLKKGDRIAQGMIIPFQQAVFKEIETIEEPNRGGLGSTGR